jgi:hypothetical protein
MQFHFQYSQKCEHLLKECYQFPCCLIISLVAHISGFSVSKLYLSPTVNFTFYSMIFLKHGIIETEYISKQMYIELLGNTTYWIKSSDLHCIICLMCFMMKIVIWGFYTVLVIIVRIFCRNTEYSFLFI